MGNLQSILSNDETRRSNRLSKPPTHKFTLSPPQLSRPETDPPELVTCLIGWENPWVGFQISELSSGTAVRAYDRTVFAQQFEEHPCGACPEYQIVSPVNRRASYHQPGTRGGSSCRQLPMVPEQPRRANSLQASPFQRPRSVIYESAIEEAASSNTHFLVDNQRFSLTRRRSLLTRPGVATRRTTGAIRRMSSPIGEPASPTDDATELQWPLPPRRRPPLSVLPPARPSSPADSRYTQLGALKLGSLRVVNGSSPCPSERIPLSRSRATSTGLGLENVETSTPRGSVLKIPSGSDIKQSDDIPGSPFSFEESPILTAQPRSFPAEPEDEGVGICDDAKISNSSNSQPDKPPTDIIGRTTSQSLNKSDSGYSSANSVCSFQHSRTRGSFDSQLSGSCGTDSSQNAWPSIYSSFPQPVNTVQRPLSLQETTRGHDARLRLAVPIWNESDNQARQSPASLRSRRSTFCASPFVPPGDQTSPARGSVYDGEFPPSLAHAVYDPKYPSTTLGAPANYPQMMSSETARLHHSVSEYRPSGGYHPHASSISRSQRRSSRMWTAKPSADIPPLPTILSPYHLQAEEDKDLDWFESSRSRPRSRSHDRRRRKLTKPRQHDDVHFTSSPFVIH